MSCYLNRLSMLLLSTSLCAVACIDPDSDTPSQLIEMGGDELTAGEGNVGGERAGREGGEDGGELAGSLAGELAGEPVPIIAPDQVSVATYNVQNLFDFIDDPDRSEGEFTPNVGSWSRGAYTAKLESIAEAIILIDADIVALQEVESEEVLIELSQVITRRGGKTYTHVATSSTRDPRGIKLGVLSMYPITREIGRPISAEVSCGNGEVLNGSRPEARPIYEVNLWSDGTGEGGGGGAQSLTLLINHWKSRASGDYPCRVALHHERGATQLRELLDGWAEVEPERAVIVLGDFNATESEPALSDQLNATLSGSEALESATLSNLWGELGVSAGDPANATTGTYRYEGTWSRIDHIFVTPAMLTQRSSWSVERFEQVRDSFLLRDGAPFYWSSERREGYSDHLPLKVTLRRR